MEEHCQIHLQQATLPKMPKSEKDATGNKKKGGGAIFLMNKDFHQTPQ